MSSNCVFLQEVIDFSTVETGLICATNLFSFKGAPTESYKVEIPNYNEAKDSYRFKYAINDDHTAYRKSMVEIKNSNAFHLLFCDGAVISFSYKVSNCEITEGNYYYLPEKVYKYTKDDHYNDVDRPKLTSSKEVKSRMRVDIDHKSKKICTHPAIHLTIEDTKNCRIEIMDKATPLDFVLIILNMYYSDVLIGKFEKNLKSYLSITKPIIILDE